MTAAAHLNREVREARFENNLSAAIHRQSRSQFRCGRADKTERLLCRLVRKCASVTRAMINRPNAFSLAPSIALALLACCGSNNHASRQNVGPSGVDHAAPGKLLLASNAFTPGQPIPAPYTCDGSNETPALSWNDPPPGTKGFALVIEDPDAPGGTFRHWGIYDIPASARSLGQGQKLGKVAINDFGKAAYGGPCPPKGDGHHHYHFRLFALDVDRLKLEGEAKAVDVEQNASRHAIAQGELIGTYERP